MPTKLHVPADHKQGTSFRRIAFGKQRQLRLIILDLQLAGAMIARDWLRLIAAAKNRASPRVLHDSANSKI